MVDVEKSFVEIHIDRGSGYGYWRTLTRDSQERLHDTALRGIELARAWLVHNDKKALTIKAIVKDVEIERDLLTWNNKDY